jgi:uncharacterized phage protein (TIGR01671 family)
MREIKFRAWDKRLEEMVDLGTHIQDYIEFPPFSPNRLEFDLMFMQYTGLNDKNGVEIYEGDIISCITISGFNETSEHIGIVEYPEDDSGFFLKVKSIKKVYEISDKTKGIETTSKNYWTTLKHHANEVIGNIYENKELLNV